MNTGDPGETQYLLSIGLTDSCHGWDSRHLPQDTGQGQHFGPGSGILLAGGCELGTAHGGAQLALQAPGLPHTDSFPSLMALASCPPHPVRHTWSMALLGFSHLLKVHQHSPVTVAWLSFLLLLPRGFKP